MLKCNEIVSEAQLYVGTKMRHQGRSKETGIDCVGLIVLVARKFGVSDHDFSQYPPCPPPGLLVTEFKKAGLIEVPIVSMQDGDVLCFWIFNPAHVIHCGFKSPIGMIHTYGSAGKVGEHTLEGTVWSRRIGNVFRFPGVIPWQ